jgi:PAS domain S-box-containing protein
MALSSEDLARRHLAKIVDSSDDAIVSKDLNGIIQSWNSAAERMFGFTAAEAVGQSIRIIIPADRQHEEDYVLGQIRAGRPVRHYETIRQHKDGSTRPISLTVSPIFDDRGQVIGASKIARDVSEQARLRAEAQEQARIAEQLGHVGTTLAASLDREAIVTRVTNVGIELTGAEVGRLIDDVADGHASALRIDDITAEPDGRDAVPLHRVPAGGPVRAYLWVPVTDRSGTVIGALAFGHSRPGAFTARHEQLAEGVAAWASIALENARLYHAAREADRLKDEFLAVLSHELRTPLNAIVGYARLLRGGVLDGVRGAQAMETLERNANALTQIVEDVLDVSRIISGKVRLDVQPVELPLVVQNAVETVRPAADAKGVRLQTIIDPRLAPVSGDPNRLQQVVWNLLSNAVKFTPREGRVQVRVERVNSHVEIAVSDTGAGIRPDFLPYVFDRFRQADSSTTRKTGGLGLGLSIVRHIVELHGGTVQAASEGERHGATFRVRLPVMIVHAQAAAEPRVHPRSAAPPPLTELGDLRGLTVFAVDDDADALTLLATVVEAAGGKPLTFSSPRAALAALPGSGADVLIVDLGMPELDGFHFITEVRRSADLAVRTLPAAALTAFARSDDRTRALRSGFEMHLAKPVDPAELVASIATLARRAGRQPSQ